jgi:para-aminobenzoate synthetase component 1
MQRTVSLSQNIQMNNITPMPIEVKPVEFKNNIAAQLFTHIEQLPWAMLLRSASADHIDSRYDILVAQPLVTLTTYGQATEVVAPDRRYQSEVDPFTLLAQLQQRYLPPIDCSSSLPFIGGALGYFSYDLGRRIERLPEQAVHDIDMPDMAVGLYCWALVVDNHLKTAHIVGQNVEAAWEWLCEQRAISEPHDPFQLTGDWHSNMDRKTYAEKFNRVQDYLTAGDCYQINLAQRFNASYQGSEWQAYCQLEQSNRAPFSAFIRLQDGAILSVSPERFLQLRHGVIETKPIKGTRPRSLETEHDHALARELRESEKDQAENLMIVDLLRNDIGRVAKPGTVNVPHLFEIESFPAVHHLVSTVRATLDPQYHAADLLRACFPGGSITGAPKVRAMQIIEELEPHRRSAYCGSIGYISRDGQMDTSITIRTLVAHKNTLYAWAGGGVVADSQCAAEYQETFDKLSRILPTLKNS